VRRGAWLACLLLAATPAVAQAPALPGGATPPPASPNTPQTAPPAPAPESWVPLGGVELEALDKVSARAVTLSGRIGQPIRYAALTITARACVVRPPDQPADAAAYLDIVDSHPAMPHFDGWMLLSEPALSMLEHPVYDITLKGCLP
jgi:hypothetical protein